MADGMVNLMELAPADVPERFKASFYFDFKAHAFEHAALFGGKNEHSVIAAISGIHDYAAAALAGIIGRAKPACTRTEADFADRCTGRFSVILEEGAVFAPSFVVGGTDRSATICLGRNARVLGANIWLDAGNIAIGEGTVVEPGVERLAPALADVTADELLRLQ